MARYALTHLDPRAHSGAPNTYVCDVEERGQASGQRCLEIEVAGERRSAVVLSACNPFLVLVDNRPLELLEHEGRYTVLGSGLEFAEALTRSASRSSNPSASGTVIAPMPGKVVRVLCQLGNTVEVGTPLVVLEAMKMENELRATRAGRVSAIYVTEGCAVESRAKLLELS